MEKGLGDEEKRVGDKLGREGGEFVCVCTRVCSECENECVCKYYCVRMYVCVSARACDYVCMRLDPLHGQRIQSRPAGFMFLSSRELHEY